MQLYSHQQKALNETKDFNRVAYYLDMGLGKTFVGAEKMKLFKRKNKNWAVLKVSNIVQYDSMGYPRVLCICSDGEQRWIDTYDKEDDVEIKWTNAPKNGWIKVHGFECFEPIRRTK